MNIDGYRGATRIIPIFGVQIAQLKSPISMTTVFRARGHDAIVVPIHVTPAEADRMVDAFALAKNIDGVIATVPHKFLAFRHCKTVTPRAKVLEAANLIRRSADGSWHGDMVDGLSFVHAARSKGCDFKGSRTLLVGAGGAGSAIGLEMLNSGAAELAIHDADTARRDALIAKLSGPHPNKVLTGSMDPAGFDVVVNATPMGMKPTDPAPIALDRLTRAMFVGDVITAPEMTPLLGAAQKAGARFSTGIEMIRASVEIQVNFFLGRDGESGPGTPG